MEYIYRLPIFDHLVDFDGFHLALDIQTPPAKVLGV